MRVLGIDPGSRALGWGIVEPATRGGGAGQRLLHVASGAIEGRAAVFAERMAAMVETLRAAMLRFSPSVCAMESAFAGRNVHSALVLGQARGAVMVAVAQAGMRVYEYAPREVKLAACGHGGADKVQVQAMVRMLLALGGSPLPYDTTDALAVAICHAHRPLQAPS